MEDLNVSAESDSSLKKYFKYMVTNRNVSIQFSTRKIRDMIETDLQINLFDQSIYAKVCTEAFAYYIRTWPEWYSNNDYEYSESGYERLKVYLRTKLLNLKKIEKVLSKKNSTVQTIELPSDETDPNEQYELHVHLPNYICSSNNVISFKTIAEESLLMELNASTDNMSLTAKEIFYYPFVAVELKIPGLIRIIRSHPFEYEQFLFKYDDGNAPQFDIDDTHIRSISYDSTQPLKVFSYNLLSVFFKQLNNMLVKYPQISHMRRLEIESLCEAFLDDVSETNISLTTTLEKATVTYNIGKKQYYVDRDLSPDKLYVLTTINIKLELGKSKPSSTRVNNSRKIKRNGKTIHRKIWTPIVSYCLEDFFVTQKNVDCDGIDYFKCNKMRDKSYQTIFMQYINSSLIYKCLLCNLSFNIELLMTHLVTVHPINSTMKCLLCQQIVSTKYLLREHWKHKCEEDATE